MNVFLVGPLILREDVKYEGPSAPHHSDDLRCDLHPRSDLYLLSPFLVDQSSSFLSIGRERSARYASNPCVFVTLSQVRRLPRSHVSSLGTEISDC